MKLAFKLKSPASIPWCSTINGSGPIPAGDKLAIFDTPVNNPLYYHFDGFASRRSSDSWSLTPVYIGTKSETGLRDIIAGVLVTDQTARFISSLLAGPRDAKAFWVATKLPPALTSIRLDTTRTANRVQCAPKKSGA